MLTSIAAWSYGSAALAFLVLSVMLLTIWRDRPNGGALAIACLATVLWAGTAAWEAWLGTLTVWTEAFEAARNCAWTVFLLILLGYVQPRSRGEATRSRAVASLAVAAYLVYMAVLGARELSPSLAAVVGLVPLVLVRLGFAVLGMLLVEHLYRNKTAQERWAVKFACMAIGAMFVFDFYLYSDAALFVAVNPEIWSARGFATALCAPLLAMSVRRSASWSAGIALSRRMMFHSAALVGSAVYLLLMGFAGYLLRYFGGRWGPVMQLSFLFGAVVLLAVILFSGSFRAWLKVFISKHFYSYNYDYREEWTRFTRTLSANGPGLGERTVHALGELVESPGGALWIARENGTYELVVQPNLVRAPAVLHADSPLCGFLESRNWVVDLCEYAEMPEQYAGLSVPPEIARLPRAWLLVPLALHGRLFGIILLQQPRSPVTLNWEVIDLLKIAGSQAASYLAQHEAANALMLARQFESFNRMSTFIVHDLKNLVSQLSLMAANAHTHRDNPEFQRDMAETVTHSVEKMKLLLQRLSRGGAAERSAPLGLDQLVRQAVAAKSTFEPRPLLAACTPGVMVVADAERLERVVGHLIQNAIEATAREGRVVVTLSGDADEALVEVSDNGAGMTEEFIRERLFQPFESTKSAGMGIGAFESREYIRELGGRLEVASRPMAGTTFRVLLPRYRAGAQRVDSAA